MVETGLADRHGPWVREELPQLADLVLPGLAGFVRMKPERGENAFVSLGELERATAGRNRRPDRDDPGHAGFPCPNERPVRVVERVQVRVRVDHAAAALSIRSSSSATTSSTSSLRKSGTGSASFCPGSSWLGAQLPTQLS